MESQEINKNKSESPTSKNLIKTCNFASKILNIPQSTKNIGNKIILDSLTNKNKMENKFHNTKHSPNKELNFSRISPIHDKNKGK